MFVCAKLTHCGVQISIRRISLYFVLDCPANEGLVGRIHCRVRGGRSAESGRVRRSTR